MKFHLLVFIIAMSLLGLYDLVWLRFIASNFYKENFAILGCTTLSGMQGKGWALLATYFLMTLGFVVFVFPLLTAQPSLSNIIYGALFGLILFGVYQGTNYIVFKDWPLILVFVDTAWGMFTYGLTSCVTMGILRMLKAYGWI